MGPKTRAKVTSVCSKEPASKNANSSAKSDLSASESNPPYLIILPDTLSARARFITLCHPRTGAPTRYIHCPSSGLHEITAIKPTQERTGSWLVENIGETQLSTHNPNAQCNILSEPKFMTATPLDPLFTVLPALSADRARSIFQSGEDILEQAVTLGNQPSLRLKSDAQLPSVIEPRMKAVCDFVDIGDQAMFRLNDLKLLEELIRKANLIMSGGLPEAIELTFVSQPLAKPASHELDGKEKSETVKSMKTLVFETPELSRASSSDLQSSSGVSVFSSASEAETAISSQSLEESVDNIKTRNDNDAEIRKLLRLRTALTYVLANYVHRNTQARLEALVLSDQSPINFDPLKQHLAEIRELRARELASRSLIDYSLKRSFPGNEGSEDDFERAERKRQKEEQEKRKKLGESHGLKALKKVNVSGMKKMSAFFSKTTPKT